MFLVTVCLAVLAGYSTAQNVSDDLVDTANGPVGGVLKASRNPAIQYVSFVGLRYADPPKRFEPAKLLETTWTEPKIANVPGNPCPQFGETGGVHDNEDCLFLNVYVPKAVLGGSDKKLPVLVWIHGGGFAFGDGTSYGADYFMETEDVVLVTINYRLGVLGFISMETDTSFTANNGLRDIVVALQWIQKNIAKFNGDPNTVTIAGNSAGSVSVHYLLMSPLATGLFHRAIMQSGAFSQWSYSPNPRKNALLLATFLSCPDSEEPAVVRKCLEEKSVKDLLIGQQAFFPRWPTGNFVSRFLPTAKEPKHNAFFTREPSSYFTFHGQPTKYLNHVPVMAGVVRDEGTTCFTAFVLKEEDNLKKLDVGWNRLAPKAFAYDSFMQPSKFPSVSKQLRDFYFGNAPLTNSSVEFLSAMFTDSFFHLPVMQAITDMGQAGMTVWPYVFTYLAEWNLRVGFNLPDIPGTVGHADELQYLFPHPGLGPPLKPDSDSEKFSKRFVKFWTQFVKNGEPGQWFEGEPLNWNPISKSSKNLEPLRINSDPKIITKFEYLDRLNLWRKVFREATGSSKKSPSRNEL